MRSPTVPFALGLIVILALPAHAQDGDEGEAEGTIYNYGGVPLRLPAERRPPVDIISPTSVERGDREPGDTTVRGRSSGRTTINDDGVEVHVYQSSRVAGVEHSYTARDRFEWFYAAEDVYFGIIPHIRDTLPHIGVQQQRGQARAQPNRVTWIGFQPFPGQTRVFVQLARIPSYTVREYEDGRIISLEFDNTRLSLSNFARPVDTSFFGRSVEMIDGEDLPNSRARVVIWRANDEPYTVRNDGEYVYVEFEETRQRASGAAATTP